VTVNHLVGGSSPSQRANFFIRRHILKNDALPEKSDPILEAEAAGFDIQLLDLNLSLSPEQRIEQHQSALSLVLDLEKIRIARDENA
jgi:hypothetical protein